ncbi:MAG: BatA domain-containing protein [Planctomycetes bacterium]|nr:BatA domain-containing protein [Planctomycetota bacterium]
MTFLTPFMLAGALAAGIPVAIHFFFRSRYRTVPWAAMKFLLTSVEQTSRRLKFQELLLLLLRMAVLVMLAIAFARPISSAVVGTGRGDSVDAALVFDVSYSMAAQDGAKSRLQRAKDEALKIIDELPPQSTVQIITCTEKNHTLVGPRSPGNLDQARLLVQNLEIAHRATDLSPGVIEAQGVLQRGQASNKELYIFSDMQAQGFEKEGDKLKATLTAIKEKALIHLIRCGKGNLKNVAIVGITPQTGIPRPGERVGFAVLVKNTGRDAAENLTVSLAVAGDKAPPEKAIIKKLPPGETRAVTLDAKLETAGLRVLSAKVIQDDLDADNRFDHVILVREQVNILVVDGNYKEKDADTSSSYFLMHSLLPVREEQRATYKYNPRVVPARQATALHLKNQDVVVLVNCSLKAKLGKRADVLQAEFVNGLEPFVRKGKGLVIFCGDNVDPESYNTTLGKKLGLLPMPIKSLFKAEKKPLLVNRTSFGNGPPAYWVFKDEKYYEDFNNVEVWKHVDLDEAAVAKKIEPKKKPTPLDEADPDDPEAKDKNDAKEKPSPKDESPLSVVVRLSNGKPLAVAKKVDSGEVLFVATAAHHEGLDPKTFIPSWTDFGTAPQFIPFMDVTINYLVNGQTQTYNLKAGDTLNWYVTDKQDFVYNLVHPDGKVARLGTPERIGKRFIVTASDLPRAGVYHMTVHPRGADSSGDTIDPAEAAKIGTPIAVIPDLSESENLATLSEADIDSRLGFTPIHIVAGENSVSTGDERLNREWTVWALLAVLALVLLEAGFAWWCGRAW